MADSNKTERATPKKRRDERKKGNTYKSKDIVSMLSLLLGFFLLVKLGPFMSAEMKELYLYIMNMSASLDELSINQSTAIARQAIFIVFLTTGPIMVAMFILGIAANGIQTGFNVAWETIKFKFSRINPIEGTKRLFSLRSIVELVKSIAKIAVIIWLVFSTVRAMMTAAPDLLNTQIDVGLLFMINEIMRMVYIVCLIFAAIAALDFFYQRYDYEKKLRMSKQEVKDEYKQTEGDPMIKGKRREKQREISMSRMMQQVPQADVVVRNPTHFAVALKYDIDADPAPLVLAKGQDFVAQRIVSIAQQHNVLLRENPMLARSLYAAADVGEYIPAEFYHTVAEVMAWVYEQQDREIKPAAKVN
ncbi:MAG: flagellar biosynthesis protein FlhB [Clostridiales Family XIII bacterium]|jgi:flagellar biosynthetic protein FlhB|nr:flagellar biosynthesis protein FlhB [Clostridiales Family XIII bacterium]